ncbi:arylsulfatase [Polaribacter reichenbachii]|uniref:Arylsulfatase n=1 Tax=Polaribacter reichenbachii TaxID=996801 RepID=A0A1B8TV52_9FLAO|nr:sulfatase [Polaribacter reichenbachii]APZ45549.1 arylsulfatase [Polaribacter reichenbachii]AUC19411.1 arylsulfatase [Polaribacter reichenbachii]OBY63434.1 arylsulfatase [Polaribacter reichenbachii]
MNSFKIKSVFYSITFLLFIGCQKSTQTTIIQQPNILWINLDDLGRELSCYGNTDVKTPNMDKLAQEGIRYTNAYSNAPVCSSSRSSQITGMYPSAINVLNHRTIDKENLPDGVATIMEIFQKNGYFCSNGWAHNMNKKGKEDYNFLGNNFFDGTDWNQRKEGQPFFAQVQIHEPHRSFKYDKENAIDYKKVTLPGSYPNHPLLKADWAKYLESVQIGDKQVGQILERLEKEGLADNTIVILFGDHGRPHLRDKQWLYEGGLAIPLIVRYPKKLKAGTVKDDLISLVDITSSTLKLANIDVPKNMYGKDVLGGKKRNYIFGFRDRCGDAVDDIRSISDGKFKLIWNRMPHLPYMQLSSYKKLQYPAFSLYNVLHQKGELKYPYNQFMAKTRPEIELYNLQDDKNELYNLSDKEEYQTIKNTLFKVLSVKLKDIEKNRKPESAAAILKAKTGSYQYYLKGIKKRGLPENATDEQIVKYWEQDLLKS